jgi:hypothetical protein
MVAGQDVGERDRMSMEPYRIPKVVELIAFLAPKRKRAWGRIQMAQNIDGTKK